jgi:phosphate transport system protein
MIRHAMESFITGNLELAKGVITDEDHSDHLTKQCYESLQTSMQKDAGRIREYTHLLRGASLLEQAADIAVSIAEETVYLYKGTNIRHHHEQLDQ